MEFICSEKIRFGILGVSGHFIQRVSLGLRESPLLQTHAIASRSAQKAKAWAQKLEIPQWYDSYEEMLKNPDIDAVYIPLPNHLHFDWIKKSADAGKHILCEKPLTMTAPRAAEVVEYCRNKGVVIMEAFMYRCHPRWQRARELVAVGEIGKPQFVHTFFSFANQNPHDIRNNPDMGGGALYDIGCYAVSCARFLFDKEPIRVQCVLTRDPDFKTDVLTTGILDFGGERATFSVGTRSFAFQQVDILGSDGRMSLPVPFNIYPDVPAELRIITSVGTRSIQFKPCDQYRAEFEGFARAVYQKSDPPVPAADAVKNMRVIDALFESARTGDWIRPDSI
ncbi:MAG: Gfo/Idh/MocA family oxidoreductase [Spirochaetia bacterium]